LVPITAPAGLAAGGPVRLEADASWLVCSDICIPGEARLALELPIGSAAAPADPSIAARFSTARSRLPEPAGLHARFTASPKELRLSLPAAALAGVGQPTVSFFPLTPTVLDPAADPAPVKR